MEILTLGNNCLYLKGKEVPSLFKVIFFPVYIVYNSAMITYAKITGAINLHFIGAHVRFFHSVSRVELAIQLCVGQRRVWYASWIPHKKKISYSEKNWAVSFLQSFSLYLFRFKTAESLRIGHFRVTKTPTFKTSAKPFFLCMKVKKHIFISMPSHLASL